MRLSDLLELALRRAFVRAPPQKLGTVSETVGGDLVVTYFDNQFGVQGLPLCASIAAPTAGSARGLPGEPWRGAQGLKPFRQLRPVFATDRGSEADMIEFAVRIVEAEQK